MKSGMNFKVKDNLEENVKAVKEIVDSFEFSYNKKIKRFHLKRLRDTVFIFCKRDRIIVNVLFNSSIDKDYIDEAALEMLKLDSKYHLNLGLDDTNGEITADFTIFTPVNPCSPQVFEELFSKHISNIEKRYNEIFFVLNEYILRDFSIVSEDFLNMKINLLGKELEKLLEDVESDDCSESSDDSETGLFPFDITDLMDTDRN